MENKNQSASPILSQSEKGDFGKTFYDHRGGFSKHELAALMIAQGLSANVNSGVFDMEENEDLIAKISYSLASKVLDQFK